MGPPLEFAAAIVLPVAAACAAIGGARLLKWLSEQPPARAPAPEPIERLHADLVRLRAEFEAMETRSDLPAKNLRLRALRAAYVDALKDACQRLDVSVPPGARTRGEDIRQTDIYRMEAGLRARGLDVREVVQR